MKTRRLWVLQRHLGLRVWLAVLTALGILAGLSILDPLLRGLATSDQPLLAVRDVLFDLPTSLELLLPAACLAGFVWVLSSWCVDGQLHAARMLGYSPLQILATLAVGVLLLYGAILGIRELAYRGKPAGHHQVVLANGGILSWGPMPKKPRGSGKERPYHYYLYWPPPSQGEHLHPPSGARLGASPGPGAPAQRDAPPQAVRGLGYLVQGATGSASDPALAWHPADPATGAADLSRRWAPPAPAAFLDSPPEPGHMASGALLRELRAATPNSRRARALQVELAVRATLPLALLATMALAMALVLRMPVHWAVLPRRLTGVVLAVAFQFAHHALVTSGQLLLISPWILSLAFSLGLAAWAAAWLRRA